jgi:hypothetical protein
MAENSILIKIAADTARVQADMAKVSSVVKSHADQMSASFSGLKSSLAGIISVGALALLAKDSVETAHSVELMSEKFGIGANELSTYMVSAKMAGVDIDNVGKGLKFLAKNAVDSVSGTGKAAGAFQSMGIDVKDASGNIKPMSALLDEIRGKFSTYAEGPEKAALAMKIFGREGANLVPWLSKSTEEIERVNKVARDFGAIMSDEAIGVTAQFADNLHLVEFAGKGLANQVMAGISPALNQVVEDTVAWLTETEALTIAAQGLIAVVKGLVGFTYALIAVFRLAGDAIAGIALSTGQWAAGVAKMLAFDFAGAEEEWRNAGASWKAMLEQMDADNKKYVASMTAAGIGSSAAPKTPAAKAKKVVAPMISEGEGDFDKIRKKIEELNAISLTGVAKQFADLDNKVASFGTEISKSKTLTGEQVRELNALAEATAAAAKQTAFSTALEKLRSKELTGMAKQFSEIDASVKIATDAIAADKKMTDEQKESMTKAAIAAGEFAKETYSSAAALKLQEAQLESSDKYLKETTDALIAARDATKAFFDADATPLIKALDGLDKQAQATIEAIRKAYQVDAETPSNPEAVAEEQAVRDKLEQRKALLLEIGGIEREQALQAAEFYASKGIAIDVENEALNAQREVLFNVAMQYGDVTTALSQLNDGMLEHQQMLDDSKAYVNAFVDVWKEAHKSIGRMALDIGMTIRDGLIGSLTDVIMGAKTAGEAFKELGKAVLKMLIETLLKWVINRAIMFAMGGAFMAAEVTASTLAAAAVATAWAPAAAAVSLATLGANAVPAAAGIVTVFALTEALASAAGAGSGEGAGAGFGAGMEGIPVGGVAHGGLDYVPERSTFLLQQGERVLAPDQNKDLTEFLKGGNAAPVGGDVYLDGDLVGKWLERRSRNYGGTKLAFT